MMAQQLNTDVIANNIANVNTTGFKKSRADFQDLLYQTVRPAGTSNSAGAQVPIGIQVGHGTKPIGIQKVFEQGDYVAIMAYLPYSAQTDAALDGLRLALRNSLRCATTVGYGPRFLHSTGQLHKGDGNNGLFIQITQTPPEDAAIPDEQYTFATLVAAQAQGDYNALAENGRRLIRFHLEQGVDVATAIKKLIG